MSLQDQPFFPNHHIRTYCLYLGSVKIKDSMYDFGVYIKPDKSVSHAIVFGDHDPEYYSGEFIFQDEWLPETFRFNSLIYKLNETFYNLYLEDPSIFPQPKEQ